MLEILWKLIQSEAKSIHEYYQFSGLMFDESAEAEALNAVIQKIIAEERAHLSALQYIVNAASKDKPDTDIPEFARQALAEYRDQKKLIK